MESPQHNIRSRMDLLRLYRRFVRQAKIPRTWLARPIVFSFFASIFEGLSVTMLIPLINGIVQNDFSFVQELAIVGQVTSRLPSYFKTGNRNLIVLLLALTFLFSVFWLREKSTLKEIAGIVLIVGSLLLIVLGSL